MKNFKKEVGRRRNEGRTWQGEKRKRRQNIKRRRRRKKKGRR